MMAPPEIRAFLEAKIPLFAGLAAERIGALVSGSRMVSFEANEAIVHHGDEVRHFGIVLSGTVIASVIAEGGVRQELGRLDAGGTFGDMALMTGDTALADLIAESHCDVLLIPVSLFQSEIVAEPRAGILRRGTHALAPAPGHAILEDTPFRLYYELYGARAGDLLAVSIRVVPSKSESLIGRLGDLIASREAFSVEFEEDAVPDADGSLSIGGQAHSECRTAAG